MKCTRLIALVLLVAALDARLTVFAQGTAFTYAGRLTSGGSAASGSFDFRFALFDSGNGETPVAGPITNNATVVSNGLFAVLLDFGANIFNGAPRWLEIGARTNGGGAFTTLAPRQPLTPTPYAIYAGGAATAAFATSASSVAPGGVNTAQLADAAVTTTKLGDGSITAAKIPNGQVVKSVNSLRDEVSLIPGTNVSLALISNALQISAVATVGWSLSGNSGTTTGNFVGTTDNQPLEFKVDGARALRLEPAGSGVSPNLVGGSLLNAASDSIKGATIAGGGDFAFGDVLWNTVTADYGTIAGGAGNVAGRYGAVPGGYANTAAGNFSFAAGNRAKAIHAGSFVWSDSQTDNFSSMTSNQFLIRAKGGVGIGTSNPVKALDVRDGSGPSGDGGGIHVGGTGVNGDPKLINFGDGDFVHIGENFADDLLDFKAGRFFFNSGSVGIGTMTPQSALDVVGIVRSLSASTSSDPLTSGALFATNSATGHFVSLGGSDGGIAYGILAVAPVGDPFRRAGWFNGNVDVYGTVRALDIDAGSKSFRIDHPLAPRTRYLRHSCVESPERKNVYDGVVSLDAAGEAAVELPRYFEALNENFRYQLTAIGAPAPNLHIAEKISDNRFKIAGGPGGLEVSWQVTGTRKDAYAKAHPLIVEEDKPEQEVSPLNNQALTPR